MQISILNKEIVNKGKYSQLEVSYKDLDNGKVASKKLMSFVKPDTAYKTLVDCKPGETYQISLQKNQESGYWDWIGATQNAPGSSTVETKSTGTPAPKSNYETAEERAKRQVYIVRQSSLANAISVLTTGAKTPPNKEEVFKLAQEFTDWVFEKPAFKIESLADMPNDFEDVQ